MDVGGNRALKLASELDGDGWSLVKMSTSSNATAAYMCMLQGFNGVGDNVNQYAGHEIGRKS